MKKSKLKLFNNDSIIIKTGIFLGTFIIYSILFLLFNFILNNYVILLSLLPIMLLGWFTGVKMGVLSGFFILPVHILLLYISSNTQLIISARGLFISGHAFLIFLGFLTGRIHDLKKALKNIQGLNNHSGTVGERINNDLTKAESPLLQKALYDELTGLPNREYFINSLSNMLKKYKKTKNNFCALIYLDLDRFQIVNDSLGYSMGNLLLNMVAKRLQVRLRSADVLSRFWGGAFVILLDKINNVFDAARFAENIQKVLNLPFHLGKKFVSITVSIGIVMCGETEKKPEELLRDAETAMHRAKSHGKARHVVFKEDMHSDAVNLLHLEADLRQAVDENHFKILYQPVVSFKTCKIIGVEALVRWKHPQHGVIIPSRFIPLAEETGLINIIGKWVLQAACSQLKKWHKIGKDKLFVAVNCSPIQFKKNEFIKTVRKILHENDLDSSYLQLELTESSVINDKQSHKMLQQLKNIGIMLSVDDFGTGYSSLGYLKRLPISSIKIDKSFVRDIPNDRDTSAITEAIIAMAHKLNLKVIAEGVENADQARFLRDNECDELQGFYFSNPVPAETIEKYLINNKCLVI